MASVAPLGWISSDEKEKGPLQRIARTTTFWARATGIYMSYKAVQLKSAALRAQGWDEERLEKEVWQPHHDRAGKRMYSLCVDLRGFYLKVGQFMGARGDFLPEPMCNQLARLHDSVPPMPPAQAQAVIEQEMNGTPLGEVFEWIDLEKPLGSASIAQVHKAKLRGRDLPSQGRFRLPRLWKRGAPATAALQQAQLPPHALAAALALQSKDGPENGVVAVKVQYPDALQTMKSDLSNIRMAAAYLSKTELKFDLVSPVDELNKQIQLEFDFEREARIMDTVASQLKAQGCGQRIVVPRSVPGLVTRRLLVMNFLDGVPIMKLGQHTAGLPEYKRKAAAKLILCNVSEAYGRMMLGEGLFQADGHPGNILVMKGGKVGLIDYGQSKQLPHDIRLAFAQLVRTLADADVRDIAAPTMDPAAAKKISQALDGVGVVTEQDDQPVRARMAYGMFDTRGRVDPFDKDSPIKKVGVSHFPADLFFVLRVCQLLRGLAQGMKLGGEFSTATQWRPFADAALRGKSLAEKPPLQHHYGS